MKRNFSILKRTLVMSLFTAVFLFAVNDSKAQNSPSVKAQSGKKFTHSLAGNPYLPLWEHLPDGEPRVFEDPDNPGKYRAYIIGSHDLRFSSYCGPDIRAWSAPVEDLSSWRGIDPAALHGVCHDRAFLVERSGGTGNIDRA